MDNKFSSRTVAAITNLSEKSLSKRKEDYKWRKNMEEYENSAQFKLEATVRNVASRQRKRKEREEKADDWKPPIPVVAATTSKRRTQAKTEGATRQVPVKLAVREADDGNSGSASPPRKSWRERVAAKDEEATLNQVKVTPSAAKSSAEKKAVAIPASKSEGDGKKGSEEVKANEASGGQNETAAPTAEEESVTHKLRTDFNSMMGGLEAEMEAGRSKLAKLRERIRKAKGAIKATDDALAKTAQG